MQIANHDFLYKFGLHGRELEDDPVIVIHDCYNHTDHAPNAGLLKPSWTFIRTIWTFIRTIRTFIRSPDYPDIYPDYPDIYPDYPDYPDIYPDYPDFYPDYPDFYPDYPGFYPDYPKLEIEREIIPWEVSARVKIDGHRDTKMDINDNDGPSLESKIIDLFRKFDVNKDGTLSHQEFMDGILQTGIPTPRSCFPMIIREFDRDDSGDINYREFAAALKRYEFKPKTEGEAIDYEVQRQVDRCVCRRRFNCVQVGEAKYRYVNMSPPSQIYTSRAPNTPSLLRFGNMQKLYLVRILSTVVMVRVGGGWQPLHEFLQKYDPCRAKGRTNVDLGKVTVGGGRPALLPSAGGSGKLYTPLKFMTAIRPTSTSTPRGKASYPTADLTRGRLVPPERRLNYPGNARPTATSPTGRRSSVTSPSSPTSPTGRRASSVAALGSRRSSEAPAFNRQKSNNNLRETDLAAHEAPQPGVRRMRRASVATPSMGGPAPAARRTRRLSSVSDTPFVLE
eukprot:sb/3464021/